ncbi:MAG: hypothetical protein IZT59_04810 [Verrucomicrobia bacterium]|jgi:3-oxoacyl-[acyl-carrier-protein] synthase-3|nr:hypothetical protein [Verrucomicrobiota bacterium]|tara:strand:+ start:20503 stop:20883 length:381 start_codon:yes stop_codon:yes gene_type:complete
MNAYITRTGSFLPGDPVSNEELSTFMGEQNPTHDVYDLAVLAAENCLGNGSHEIDHLSAGSTNTPLIGPGISSILHSRLAAHGLVSQPLEINSNSGICSASAQSFVNSCRAIHCGDHSSALCIGVE